MTDQIKKIEREITIADPSVKLKTKRYEVSKFKLLTWWWWPYAGQELLHYAKNVNTDMAKAAGRQLNKWSWIWLVVGAAFWLVTLNVDNWLRDEPTYLPHWAIFLILTYCTGTTIINFHFVWPKNRFAVPDYKPLLKKDNGIPANQAPQPDRNRFVLGYDGREPVFASFNTKGYGSTCRYLLYGQNGRWGKEELPYTFLWGAFGGECVCLVFDCNGGVDFSALRYESFVELYKEEFKSLYRRDKWDFILQMKSLPNVVVRNGTRDKREINDSLFWLDRELMRRQEEKSYIPEANWPHLLVVLDEELADYYFARGGDGGRTKTPEYENLTALDRLIYGKNLNTSVVAMASPTHQWGSLSPKYADFFESVEVRHRVVAPQKDEGKQQFTLRNVVAPAAFTIRYWPRGESIDIKAVQIKLPELAAWILKCSATFSQETDNLYAACLDNTPYVDVKLSETPEVLSERKLNIAGMEIKQVMKSGKWFTPKSEQKKLKEAA